VGLKVAKGGPRANGWNLLLLLLYIARIYSLFQKWITICLESLWVLSHFNSNEFIDFQLTSFSCLDLLLELLFVNVAQ
jgi:hypothetical protein